MRRGLLMAALAGVLARSAAAQCPDGTPPPCARAAPRVRQAPPPLAERGRHFLILPFRNLSRSPELDWLVEGSTTILAEALGRWRELQVVPDERLYPALRRAGLLSGGLMDMTRVRGVAEETGGWTAVTGDLVATGGRILVSARAFDIVTNRELVRTRTQEVPAGGDVRDAFERVAAALLPIAGLQTEAAEPGLPTTQSLDAYRAYLRARAEAHRSHYRTARDALLEAVRLDSTFAQAYVLLAQCSLFINPLSLFEPQSDAGRYAARAYELSAQLPQAQRDVAAAVNEMFEGQVTAARAVLERRIAADSNDEWAAGMLSLLEWGDPILVPAGAGERPRGSLNRSLRIARRTLELNPDNHAAYQPITLALAYTGGELPGVILGVRREGASFRDMLLGGAPRMFATVYLADSIALIPAESLPSLPPESLAATRRRGIAAARAWSDRWLEVGHDEGEAHLMAARIAHRQGALARAMAELDTASALGIESGISAPAYLRLTLLAESGRYDAARARADSMFAAGRFDRLRPLPSEWMEAEAWAFGAYLMHGDDARAFDLVDRVADSFRNFGLLPDTSMATFAALPLMAGAAVPPAWLFELPAGFRAEVMDSVWQRHASLPDTSRLARALPLLRTLASRAALADTALAGRIRAAPWYLPGR